MMKSLVAAVALAWCAASASAAAPTPLDRYLEDLASLRADFVQTLTDAKGAEIQSASGSLLVLRPGRFRWELRPAQGSGIQLLVADGRNLWFYDEDLQQVTVKPATAALSATPAMLLSGAGNIRDAFDVKLAPAQSGLEWVEVVPRAADADFRNARLGFEGRNLRRMELHDKLGQTATLEFSRIERNSAVSVGEVSFTPPVGADLIGKPVP